MAKDSQFYFFEYNHELRDYNYVEENENLDNLMMDDRTKIPDKLEQLDIDGLLILDYTSQHWWLAYRTSLGIVGERTARRQADSIRRSGVNLPDGFWLKETKFPLEELADPNLGDLWKTVQNKYLTGDLSGLELDPETGIPSQIKERAERMKKAGHEDALTEAKQELEEAENRKRAMARSGEMTMDDFLSKPTEEKPKKGSKAKKEEPKKEEKKDKTLSDFGITMDEDEEEEEEVQEEPKAKVKKEPIAPAPTKDEDLEFVSFKIESMIEYVKGGNTVYTSSGKVSVGKKKPKQKILIFSQDYIPTKEWNEHAIFLGEGSEITITFQKIDDLNYVMNIQP
ncbi:MAG: hypothetical protein INQ03_01175 [Candidatus Heimdallarchaeota archaeon]|nr:hypothetical protein [Candidatus Heimdallarchaeota archaeon]